MDQRSFETGLRLGMVVGRNTAREHRSSSVFAEMDRLIKELEDGMSERWEGKRFMVANDIFLEMPLMTAEDLGMISSARPML